MSESETAGAGPAKGDDPSPPEPDYADIRRKLTRSVASVCPFWLASQAEDIVQAALLRVMAVLREREGGDPLGSSYLWRVAYSATVDEIRRRRRKREVGLEEANAPAIPAGSRSSPEAFRHRREVAAAIQDCLSRLVPTRRQAVTLYLEGHRVPEIASLLGWSAKKAENLAHRGVADLRRCLDAKGLRP